MKYALLFWLSLAPLGQAGSPDYFVPAHRVSGIGVARDDISDDLLEIRTDLMIQTQTFSIMRDPAAVPGAKRITGDPKLQAIFRSAAAQSGLPATIIEAVAYLESWGDARAESPTGPKGVMQISAATARSMGLRVLVKTRYRVSRERVRVPMKGGKVKFRTVTRRTPYIVTVRDDRMNPAVAIPAAARYLAGMEQKFGGRDWAIFAYHCGQGCAAEMQELTRRAKGIPKDQMSVPRMFFSANPAWNRELYAAVWQQMDRDYSPTYYFRVRRAEQLLALYRRDPAEFTELAQEYRSQYLSDRRAPHRLSVWLKRSDMVFQNCDDIRADVGRRLSRVLQDPEFTGYTLRIASDVNGGVDLYGAAAPSAIGSLAYIAYETRRLHEATKPRGEKFEPLPVTSLVETADRARLAGQRESQTHCSGEVFDIDYSGLPPGELECLRFVLADLGWQGYLGFIEEGRDSFHIGPAPSARAFFTSVFGELTGKRGMEKLALQ